MSFLYELNGIPVNEMKRSSFSQKIFKEVVVTDLFHEGGKGGV